MQQTAVMSHNILHYNVESKIEKYINIIKVFE